MSIVHPVLLDLLEGMPVSDQLELARNLRMGKRKRVRMIPREAGNAAAIG